MARGVGRALVTVGSEALTIRAKVERLAKEAPRSAAISAPGRGATTYEDLLGQMAATETRLRELGISRADRVAVALPNGPSLAAAFLSVGGCAAFAPLNPGYRANEAALLLADMDAKALIVQPRTDVECMEAARGRGIAILELVPGEGPALFGLRHPGRRTQPPDSSAPGASDPSLILHTSGTTSRPKQVSLTHENLLASARNGTATLRLTARDRCLNVMPLFHIHALIGNTLTTIFSGGEVICAPGARFPEFFEWLQKLAPTWYSAAPTIHQSVLACAAENPELVAGHRLRFIRSSAAPLPPAVEADLERVFNIPVLQAYGMTEAAYQIASNPLPPAARKPGSVGRAEGPQIAILNERGEALPEGRQGEVAIRGRNVTEGYENNPQANATHFARGWFLTGDVGYLDPDGYLFLVGRSKEIINRGGFKLSPREVDELLLTHPAVAEAATFAIPHPTLGEDVAAAVVLKPGKAASPDELRDFVAARIAEYKVPRRLVLVDGLPKTVTSKVQRVGLYEKLKERLGAFEPTTSESVQQPIDARLLAIWKQVLRTENIGPHDNFFSLGGDSLQAARVVRMAREAGIQVNPRTMFRKPTITEITKTAKRVDPSAGPEAGFLTWLRRLWGRPG